MSGILRSMAGVGVRGLNHPDAENAWKRLPPPGTVRPVGTARTGTLYRVAAGTFDRYADGIWWVK